MGVIKVLAVIAVVFGGMTIISGSTVLFTGETIRKSAGNYVEFVVWFNLISGFGYITAGIGLWIRRRWSVTLSVALTFGIAVVFAVFGIYVFKGGTFEPRTAYALTFRMLVWLTISVVSFREIKD